MTEIQAPYRVGNVLYVDFGCVPLWPRPEPRPSAPSEYGPLWQAAEAAYLQALNTPEQFTPESRAALILAITKLLEAVSEGDCCALLALRLATIELQMAFMASPDEPAAKQFFAGQCMVQLQSILDYVGDGVLAIEDGDQLIVAPTAIHMRMAAAHLLLGDDRSVSNCMEFAEESLGRLGFEGGDWMRGKLLEQITKCRDQS